MSYGTPSSARSAAKAGEASRQRLYQPTKADQRRRTTLAAARDREARERESARAMKRGPGASHAAAHLAYQPRASGSSHLRLEV